jgi:Ca-activated chloride channel family protein
MLLPLFFCLALAVLAGPGMAQSGAAGWSRPQPPEQPQTANPPQTAPAEASPPPAQASPEQAAAPAQEQPAAPPSHQPGNTVSVPAQPTGQQPEAGAGGVFVFRKDVEEVQLHATVVDQKQRLVTDLSRSDFTVYEDDVPQQITSFRREDIPVSLGIIIDNSGSMRDKRPKVNQAVINLVKASNPDDEVFIVNFNDEPYLDQSFTNSIPKMREALERIESRGGTALYDAVVASADELAKGAQREKKVLLVVTDGEDNMSRLSLEEAIRKVQEENGPTVYTIGILGDDGRDAKRAKRALRALALETGGVSFFPESLEQVDAITKAVARDIRNQYTIGYKPSRPRNQGGYRAVKVEAKASGHGKLTVRTRSGYYAEEHPASTAQRQANR